MQKSLFRVRHLVFFLILCRSISAIAEQPINAAAIATAHPYATDAGAEIIHAGGNAFDAAVAIAATLAVVEPYSSGLGGGGFWLLHRAEDGKQIMLDSREVAPLSATKDMYLDPRGELIKNASINGATAAAIPGVPAALEHLAKQYGNLSLAQTLAPAIRHAEQGFPVTARYQKLTQFRIKVLQSFPEAAKIFLLNNQMPPLGHKIIQQDLAQVLKQIAKHGANYFYTGDLAVKMVQAVSDAGGNWSKQDLLSYRIVEREPIIFNYQNVRIISAPPPSSGGIALATTLGMLAQFDLHAVSENEKKHIVIEALRRAYQDRAIYLGDPDFVHVPKEKLLHADRLNTLAMSIKRDQATPSAALGEPTILQQNGTQTTHFSIIDGQGNRVAATLSINLPFGSGFVVPNTGILLNNEMDDFSSKENTPNAYGLVGYHANSIVASKRPLSSMSPTFIESDNRVAILGTPGGSRIISMVLLAILDFMQDKAPSSWVSVARYHHQYLPDVVQFEKDGLSLVEQQALKNLGHMVVEKNRQYGNMQAVLWDKKANQLSAASDPRGEGKASVIELK